MIKRQPGAVPTASMGGGDGEDSEVAEGQVGRTSQAATRRRRCSELCVASLTRSKVASQPPSVGTRQHPRIPQQTRPHSSEPRPTCQPHARHAPALDQEVVHPGAKPHLAAQGDQVLPAGLSVRGAVWSSLVVNSGPSGWYRAPMSGRGVQRICKAEPPASDARSGAARVTSRRKHRVGCPTAQLKSRPTRLRPCLKAFKMRTSRSVPRCGLPETSTLCGQGEEQKAPWTALRRLAD